MVNHGLSTGALFLIVGYIYERRHTRDIDAFGGLWKAMPIYGFLSLIIVLSSVGLPGLNGFIGEATIMFGTAKSGFLGWPFAAFGLMGVILAAIYLLWMYRKVYMGPVTDATAKMADVTRLEVAMLVPLIALIILIGLYPTPFFAAMETSVSALAQPFGAAVAAR
jgi:NADH-quinone oxidoreductase subunit M